MGNNNKSSIIFLVIIGLFITYGITVICQSFVDTGKGNTINRNDVQIYLSQHGLSFDEKKIVLENYSRIFESNNRVLTEQELVLNKSREKNLFLLAAAGIFLTAASIFLSANSLFSQIIAKTNIPLLILFLLIPAGVIFFYIAESSKPQILLRGFQAPLVRDQGIFVSKDSYFNKSVESVIEDAERNDSIVAESTSNFRSKLQWYRLSEIFFISFLILFPVYIFIFYPFIDNLNPFIISSLLLICVMIIMDVKLKNEPIQVEEKRVKIYY